MIVWACFEVYLEGFGLDDSETETLCIGHVLNSIETRNLLKQLLAVLWSC